MNKTFIFIDDETVVVVSGESNNSIDLRNGYPRFGELADERLAYNDRVEKQNKKLDSKGRPLGYENVKHSEEHYPDWYINMT